MSDSCELTDRGIELDDGTVITWPECDGTIRRLDAHGDCRESRAPGDAGYEEWLGLLPVDAVEVEFTATFRRTLHLPKGRYDLRHELAEVRPPEDECSRYVGGTLRLTRVARNGRELPPGNGGEGR